VAACLNALNPVIYSARRAFWTRLQRGERLPDDRPFDIQGTKVAIIGMGGIGTGTYDRMREVYGETVVGVDIDLRTVRNQRATGRNVLGGDPGDADFWDRMQATHTIELVMLALPNLNAGLAVLAQLKAVGFTGKVAAMAKFQDEADALTRAGVTTVFNIYTEAGAGFAAHVLDD
jgi:glutathione-regulated potassium-efflux system ancillary protein KefC